MGLLIDPVQVLKDHHQRLIERFAQKNALDSIERAPLLYLSIHLRKRIFAFDDSEQREQIRQRVFERPIECQYVAGYFLAAAPGRHLPM